MPLCTPQEMLWPAMAGRCMVAALARQPLNSAALPLCTTVESFGRQRHRTQDLPGNPLIRPWKALAGRGTIPKTCQATP